MNNGWRSRLLAPVYALVISFVLVAILGFALQNPLRIQFTVSKSGVSEQHIKELSKLSVSVEGADGEQAPEQGQLDPSGELTPLKLYEGIIRICTMLPPGFSPAGRAEVSSDGKTCWLREAKGKVVIPLKDQIRSQIPPVPPVSNESKHPADKKLQGTGEDVESPSSRQGS